MAILLFLITVLVVGWLLAAVLSHQKRLTRRKANESATPEITYEISIDEHEDSDKDILPPPLGDQYLEFNDLDAITTDEDGKRYRGLSPEIIKSRAEYYENVIRPPEEWRLERNAEGRLIVDGDWKFILDAKNEEEWQLYVYSVKNYPDLLKIGIAKDAVKRKKILQKKTSFAKDAKT